MSSEEKDDPSLPEAFRTVGIVVILATVVVVTIMALWVLAPNLLTHSRRVEGLLVRALVTSLVISGFGGLLMTGATRNPLWLLTLLATGGAVGLWLLIAKAMGPLMN